MWAVLIGPVALYVLAFLGMPFDLGAPGPTDPEYYVVPRALFIAGLGIQTVGTVLVWILSWRHRDRTLSAWNVVAPILLLTTGALGASAVSLF